MADAGDGLPLIELFRALPMDVRRRVWRRHGEAAMLDWLMGPGSLRSAQRPPIGDWGIWVILAGRGFGKTHAGAEWVHARAAGARPRRIALVAPTLDVARAVMVEGDSGLLARLPPGQQLTWQPSAKRLLWGNGSEARLYSGAEPNSLRGGQFDYPRARQHYLADFVLSQNDAEVQWPLVADAAAAALALGVAETFVWAWPQVARDGFTPFQIDDAEDDMASFHDVRFPLQLGFGAAGGPAFSTQVVVTGSGAEQRNAEWADVRLEYDAGLGIRSEDDLKRLITFFRARRGQAHGFRFLDPLDNSSAADGGEPTALDQRLGLGDGGTTRFALVRNYGDAALPDEAPQTRRITRPWPESVVVAVAGVVLPNGWTLAPGGFVDFEAAPAAGAAVTAGFRFDVPVRFATDRIEVSIAGWRAGELPSVPLIEIRED